MAEFPAPDHDCDRFSTLTEEGEQVCIKCGIVVKEADKPSPYVSEDEGRMMSVEDHHVGNGLLNSETEQMDFVSGRNPGLSYKLRLNDAYHSGCIAGGKEMVMREDPITKEATLKFDMYDKPFLRMVKERANSELSRYGLSTVGLTIVAKELKVMTSRLVFSDILEYAWRAAAINAGVLKKKDQLAIEQEMYALLEPIKIKLLSRCDKDLAKELTAEPEAIEAKN